MYELSMAVRTPRGLVVIVGCSHPGIERILDATAKIDTRLYTVFGGLHLVDVPDTEVSTMVSRFRDQWRWSALRPGIARASLRSPSSIAFLARSSITQAWARSSLCRVESKEPRT
jgi:hypothetical protein